MTGIDLIVAAPWIAFGVALAVVCFLLLRSNHASGRGPGRPLPSSSDPAGPLPRQRRKRANQEKNNYSDPTEARFPKRDSRIRLR